MPTIARIEGVQILIYADDHPPPHVHVRDAENEAMIDIRTGKVLRGELTKSKSKPLLKWVEINQLALMRNWNMIQSGQAPEVLK
ncbi:MAG: DUF4160 domain-containing protein [Ahrensia sp.]|nr:DUF4160 domain-containing protein [Ahrensia sp.]